MFNNVWFYILLYAMAGILAVIADAENYKKMREKVKNIGFSELCRFEDEALIVSYSKAKAYIIMVIAFVLWPVYWVKATVRRNIVYKRILREKLEKEEWNRKFEEIQKRWLAG